MRGRFPSHRFRIAFHITKDAWRRYRWKRDPAHWIEGADAPGGGTMQEHIRAFIESHPNGWGHADWLGLLGELRAKGIDVGDPDAIGAELERERLAWELRRRAVPGLGPKRIDAVVRRYGSLWSLRQAGPEDLAAIKTIPGTLAEQVVAAVR